MSPKAISEKGALLEVTGIEAGAVETALGVEQRVDAVLKTWWAEEIHGSDVGRSTEAYNHLHKSMDGLKARLVAEFRED